MCRAESPGCHQSEPRGRCAGLQDGEGWPWVRDCPCKVHWVWSSRCPGLAQLLVPPSCPLGSPILSQLPATTPSLVLVPLPGTLGHFPSHADTYPRSPRVAVTSSLKPALLSLAEVQSSYLCSTRVHLGWVGPHLPTGRPRMCWGDGRAKRNRRVSWLMTCKEAQDVGQHPGQRGHQTPVSPSH